MERLCAILTAIWSLVLALIFVPLTLVLFVLDVLRILVFDIRHAKKELRELVDMAFGDVLFGDEGIFAMLGADILEMFR